MKTRINVFIPVLLFFSLLCGCNGNNVSSQSRIAEREKNERTIKYAKPASDTIAKNYVCQVVASFQNEQPQKVFYFRDSSFQELVYEIQYYENGHRKMEGGYSNGKRSGKWIAWYENDTVWSYGYYRNGLRHGVSAVYFPNGQKYYDKSYFNDTAEGKWTFYNEQGKLVGEAFYHNGKLMRETKY
ncbi:MAG: hypothetical protein KBB11_09390 [Bacteroidales bacterium]|jgi:antitoxin component YwqK of YwqJK toxin-antitoxin module|nr:hypothetical protein [Bacteroidales bacterium]HOY38346.1 hypothetical protein [Bacteroidales bacterium]HQP03441.1 hypothetical protein [Bacteroidales bacterium]